MDVLRTEEEQVEALKRWWDENGKSLIAGIVIALGAVFGWRAWQDHQRETSEAASELFFNLVEAQQQIEQGDQAASATLTHLSDTLKEEHAKSTYAVFAGLIKAKQAVANNDLETAEKELQWSVDSLKDGSSLWLIANLRLARVIAAQDGNENAERALGLIENTDAGGHQASYEEVKGDIYLQLGRIDQARGAYQAALAAARLSGVQKPLLLAKLDDVAGSEALEETTQ